MADPATGAAAAVKAALDWSASAESRQSATAFLDAIKFGDVRVLGTTAFALAKDDQPLEVRHFGLKLLQHLIRIRWDELNPPEKQNIIRMVLDMVREFAKPYEQWSVKSQVAALAAEISRREGPETWKEMLGTLLNLGNTSPVHAEMVALVLRWLPEDVIVHNEDLEGSRRRILLSELTQTLPEMLPFLYKLLEKHFAAGAEAAQKKEMDLAKQHAAVVTAGLNALLAHAEWAPITDFLNYGLIDACRFFLNSTEFRLNSCEILKQLVSRKRPADDMTEPFNSALARMFDILASVSEAYFQHLRAGGNDAVEFAECLCEALVALGTQNLQSISGSNERMAMYYRQMVSFFQHPKYALHAQALPLWLALLRDSSEQKSDKKSSGKIVPIETVAVLFDVAFQRILKQKDTDEEVEGQEEDFPSAMDYSQYRGRLIELIRLTASLHPILGISKVKQRLDTFLDRPTNETLSSQELTSLERTHTMLDAVVSGMVSSPMFIQTNELNLLMEGLFQRLLSVHWAQHELVELHAKFFDALCPYLKLVPSAIPLVVQKLFQLLISVPVVSTETNPAASKARMQVCTSFLRIAIAAGAALLPHMQLIAETMTRLQQERQLLRGEHISLGEALLIAGSAAGTEQQAQVLEWLLGPFREQWMQLEWQQKYISSPSGLVQLVSEVNNDFTEKLSSDKGMWYIYHSIAFFEKALRRCGSSTQADGVTHPMGVHMAWILPPLIQLLRCLHSLWTPSLLPTLPPVLQQAMRLSVIEQALMLGERETPARAGKEDELRNWLKGVRDSGYNILGFASSRLGNNLFVDMAGLAGGLAAALVENFSSMEFRHIRLLIHSVINPFVRFCPRTLWGAWLDQLLPPILVRCDAILPVAWENLIKEGSAKTATLFAIDGSSGLKTEVVEERILRDLTREVCSLLAVLASPELNQSQSEQQGMLFFIIQYSDAALAALRLGIQSLQWPDTYAVHKGVVFCGAVVNLAGLLNDAKLIEIVGKDMFTASIQSLTLESNAAAQSELLGLLREIIVKLSAHSPAPKQVLMSLPSITQQEFATFEASFKKTTSAKEQRQLIKSLLLVAGGDQLKALMPQKNTNIITNVTRSTPGKERAVTKPEGEGASLIGLATML